MKSKLKRRIVIIVGLVVIAIVPFFLDKILYNLHWYNSHLTSSEWSSFNGSYIGSILGATIGGIVTLVGIRMTINSTTQQANKDREFQREQANEDRRVSLAPYLKYTMYEKTLLEKRHEVEIFYCIDRDYNTYINATIELKNIGMGSLLNLKVYDLFFNNVDIGDTLDGQNEVLERNEKWLMLIDLRLRLDEIKSESIIKSPPGSIVEYLTTDEQYKKGGILSFKFGYTDLIGNQYEQNIEVSLDIYHVSQGDPTKWKNEIEIRLNKIEKSKVISKD